jgi:hypothetical protein
MRWHCRVRSVAFGLDPSILVVNTNGLFPLTIDLSPDRFSAASLTPFGRINRASKWSSGDT